MGVPKGFESVVPPPAKKNRRYTPLFTCVYRNPSISCELETLHELNFFSDDYQDIEGLALTHRSAALGNAEALIIQAKRDATLLEIADSEGQTPLMHAVVHEQMETTRILIKMGADINKQNKQGQSPLLIASYQVKRRPAFTVLCEDELLRASKCLD